MFTMEAIVGRGREDPWTVPSVAVARGWTLGSTGAADEDDLEQGHAVLRGRTPPGGMAELFGRVTGTVRGRGGFVHMFAREARLQGGHGIMGAHVPLSPCGRSGREDPCRPGRRQ
ncbi:MAG: hypothetical protein ACQEXJ_09325 [Myxococcota bacterium]